MFHRLLAVLFSGLALGLSSLDVRAAAEGSEFLEDTGTACLVGGTLVGAAALIAGPAATVTVAGTSSTPLLSAGMSGMFGCGVGATTALIYYGYKWTEHALFGEPAYPALYPLREHLEPHLPPRENSHGVISETGQ